MNTYPTTAEQLYLEQKIRDENNPGCIGYRESRIRREKFFPKTKKEKEEFEELAKKSEQDRILGYASRRYGFPEYQWWMIQDGKKYLRSSCNWNVYDYAKSSVVVGRWNEQTQRIDFPLDLTKRIDELEEMLLKLAIRLEELSSA